MRRRVNNHSLDTDTAKFLWEEDGKKVYVTLSGIFFFEYEGVLNPMSRMAAREECLEHLSKEEVDEMFGPIDNVEESFGRIATVRLPAPMLDKIDRYALRLGFHASGVINEALEMYFAKKKFS